MCVWPLEVLLDTFDGASGPINLGCLQKGIQFSLHAIPVYITATEGHFFCDMDPRYPKDIFEFQHLRQTLFRSHCAITALLFSVISQLHNLAVWRTRRKHDTFKHKAQSQISYPVPQTPAGNHFHGNWSACVLQRPPPPPPPPPASLPKSFSLLLMSKQYLSSSGVGGGGGGRRPP